MTTYSGILAWRIPWTEEPGGLWSVGLQRAKSTTEATEHALHVTCINWIKIGTRSEDLLGPLKGCFY